MKKLKICMLGLGRTGREIARAVLKESDLSLEIAICSNHNPFIGKDLGNLLNIPDTGIIMESSANLAKSLKNSPIDVAIDFSTPEAAVKNAEILAQHNTCIVVGTTGFSDIQLMRLRSVADHYNVGIVLAPNITLGVNVLMLFANLATSLLGEDYDCSIIETHFKGKKDSPSGTAKKIADAVYKGKVDSGTEDIDETIPIHSVRTGGVIGRHSLIISGENDQLEITHNSFSRNAFAQGALRAARYVNGKKGFLEMKDVLQLEECLARFAGAGSDHKNKNSELSAHKWLEVVPYVHESDTNNASSISS